MDSSQVTRRHARSIMAKVEPMRAYLYRLRDRMSRRGFPPEDRLFELMKQAEKAIDELYVDVQLRMRCGPVELPPTDKTAWLDQRSARKRDR
jgi:hypothetical protein